MNILVYLGHPAQFHFYKAVIHKLQQQGHRIIVLIKTKDILEKLLIEENFKYINIQKKNRKNTPVSIFVASLLRTYNVIKYAKRSKVDILLGTDSSVAQAAFLLGKKSITTLEDDYEVIKKLADLTYPFTNIILVPKVCSVGKWQQKKIGYKGYMKLSYLHPNQFRALDNIKTKYVKEKKYILIRLASLTAHHDFRIKGLNRVLIKRIIETATKYGYRTVISSEKELDEEFMEYKLDIDIVNIHHVMFFSSMLIGDSQSMAVEAAMLGVPSIRFSDFAGKISVLEELEHKYQLTYGIKTEQQDKFYEKVNELLMMENLREEFQARRQKMLADKIDVAAFFTWFIENYPESAKIMKETPDYQYKFK